MSDTAIFTVSEAAKILQKSQATIKRMCENKLLEAEKSGRSWRIKRGSIESRMQEGIESRAQEKKTRRKRPSAAEKAGQQEEKGQTAEGADPQAIEEIDRIIVGKGSLSRIEAERIIKQEDAIKRQTENLLREGRLIDSYAITETLEIHYRSLLDLWEQMIDGWAVRYNLPASAGQEMIAEYKIELKKSWRSVKSRLIGEYRLDRKTGPEKLYPNNRQNPRGSSIFNDA